MGAPARRRGVAARKCARPGRCVLVRRVQMDSSGGDEMTKTNPNRTLKLTKNNLRKLSIDELVKVAGGGGGDPTRVTR